MITKEFLVSILYDILLTLDEAMEKGYPKMQELARFTFIPTFRMVCPCSTGKVKYEGTMPPRHA